MRYTLAFIMLLFGMKALAASIQVSVQDMQGEVTLRLETSSVNYEYTWFEDIEITENGEFSFTKEMTPGEHFKVTVKDQPNAEICSSGDLIGVYQDSQETITLTCRNRSVTLTSLQSFISGNDNQISTVVSAISRDSGKAATGLNEEDFDIVQEDGEDNELRFSQQPEYFLHVLPLDSMSSRYHLVLSYDLSNSVTAAELSTIKFRSRTFISEIAGEGNDNLPDNIKVTINSFNEDLTIHIAESQNVEDLHNAINGLQRSNAGADLYGSTITSLNQLNTNYTPNNTESGAVVVITDGTDSSGVNSSNSVSISRGNKPLYFVAVGDEIDEADLSNMTGSTVNNRVLTAPDFTSLNARLTEITDDFFDLIDSSYLLMLSSPLRDASTNSVRIALNDQVSCVSDGLTVISTPPCFDNYSGSYRFISTTESSEPEVVVLGDSMLKEGELSPVLVKTLWSSDFPDYSIAFEHQFSEPTVTNNEQNSELSILAADFKLSSTLTVTDNNWGVEASKEIAGPQFISVNNVGTQSEQDIESVELSRSQPFAEIEINNINGEQEPQWRISLSESDYFSLVQNSEGETPTFQLQFNPGAEALNTQTTLSLEDTANRITRDFQVFGNAELLGEGDPDDILAFSDWLERFGLNFGEHAEGDYDGDGLSNLLEFQSGSSPLISDSDFDGVSDIAEFNIGASASEAAYQISIGTKHSCLLDDNDVMCALHIGETINSVVTQVPALSNPVKITSGQNYSCALHESGVSCWGLNSSIVDNVPALENVTDLASGTRNSCLIADENVQCWGHDESGILTEPVGLSNPSGLSVGFTHACVIDDTALHCWGDNSNGQLDIPGAVVNATEVVAGQYHSCAIASNNVYCWGGQLADFAVTEIPAIGNPRNLKTANNSVCVDSDDGLMCWGEGFRFKDMSPFLSQVYNARNYDMKPEGSELCVFDLDGLKCSGSFNENLLNLDTNFAAQRVQLLNRDINGDGAREIIFRLPEIYEQIELGLDGEIVNSTTFGQHINDIPLLGDFDGDGLLDIAVRRPGNGFWYVLNSGIQTFNSSDGVQRIEFARQASDVPTPGDFDGDSITDIAFWRPSNGTWYVKNSSATNLGSERQDGVQRHVFGKQSTDIPLPADYDGDGITDMAFWRSSNQTWYVKNSSSSNFNSDRNDGIQRIEVTGTTGAIAVPEDYDGDGIDDMAFYNATSGLWQIRLSSDGAFSNQTFGDDEQNIPMPADYDGDGKADLTIWDPAEKIVNMRSSVNNNNVNLNFDSPSAIPLSAPMQIRMEMAENAHSE